MTKMAIKINVILSLCLLTIVGCKDADTEPAALTKTELITSSPWVLKAVTVEPGIDFLGTIVTDFYAQVYEDCDKDDFEKYNTNGTLVYDQGEIKCDPSTSQTEISSWRFNTDESKIIIDNDDELTFDIEDLSEVTMKYSQILNGEDIGGNPLLKYKFVWTYNH